MCPCLKKFIVGLLYSLKIFVDVFIQRKVESENVVQQAIVILTAIITFLKC